MGNSLRDQLHKAGLVSDKQLKKVGKEVRKQAQHERHGGAGHADEARRQAQATAAEKAERDRQLNLERVQAAERAAALAQIKQLIEAHALPFGVEEVDYHFVRDGKVKTLPVSRHVQAQLANGRLIIVALERGYALVNPEVADKIRERDPSYFVLELGTRAPDANDSEYAQYQVPDDLMW